MLNIEEIFTPDEMQELAHAVVEFEVDVYADPDNLEPWVEDLNESFAEQLDGREFDEETITYLRKKFRRKINAYKAQVAEELRRNAEKEIRELDIRTTITRMRGEGATFAAIARELDIPAHEVMRRAVRIRYSENDLASIRNGRAAQLEQIRAENYGTIEQRIVFIGEQLKRLRDELNTRDLSDMPTDKLLDHAARYMALLRTERGEPGTVLVHGPGASSLDIDTVNI